MLQCIYCGGDSSAATHRAHAFPEGLLHNALLLPLGAECDTCNERLGRLDKSLIHHNRIWVPIVLLSAPGKKGRTRRQLGHFTVDEAAGRFRATIPETWIRFDEAGRPLRVELPNPPEFDDLRFRRGLYHIALNYVALKYGVVYALQPEFDNARRYVRFARKGEAWDYAQVMFQDDQFNRELHVSKVDVAPGFTVRFKSYLDEFYMDLLNTGELHAWAASNLDRPGCF